LQTIQQFISDDMVVIMVVHDINWALAYADKVYLLKEGNLIAQGNPIEIITPSLISEVFNIEAQLINVPGKEQMVVVY
jgi:iron complex transport system ATP-binding protein